MSQIVVVGSGQWGMALAHLLAHHHHVTVISRSKERAQRLRSQQQRSPSVNISHELERHCPYANALYFVLPVQETESFLAQYHHHLPTAAPIVMCNKGIDRKSFLTPGEMVARHLAHQQLAVLSGPNFASEIRQNLAAATVIAAENMELASSLCQQISSDSFRAYASTDVIGVSLCGALKNVLALATGILIGKGYGENARAALITRGLNEMGKYVQENGGQRQTIYGLAGIGDTLLTCGSERSRNFAFGLEIARHETTPIDELIKQTPHLVEGIATCTAIAAAAKKRSIDMPISSGLNDLILGRITISGLAKALLRRPLTSDLSSNS